MKVKKEAIIVAKALPALAADFITTARALNAQKSDTALESYEQALDRIVRGLQAVVDKVAIWKI